MGKRVGVEWGEEAWSLVVCEDVISRERGDVVAREREDVFLGGGRRREVALARQRGEKE